MSIIIPIYNQPQVLDFFVRRNIENADGIVEWVIIDNNSDHETRTMISDLAKLARSKGHLWTLKTEKENTGVARAWNTGLGLASSRFICILNNDCFFGTNWVSRMLEAWQNSNLDIFTPFIVEPGMNKPENTPEYFLANYEDWQRKNAKRIRKSIFSGVVICASATVFQQLGGFDDQFWLSHEDIDFLLRARRDGLQVGITAEIMGFHNVSATRKRVETKEEENSQRFEQKWGFNYRDVQSKALNKLIRSWQKRLWRYRFRMSRLRQRFPV